MLIYIRFKSYFLLLELVSNFIFAFKRLLLVREYGHLQLNTCSFLSRNTMAPECRMLYMLTIWYCNLWSISPLSIREEMGSGLYFLYSQTRTGQWLSLLNSIGQLCFYLQRETLARKREKCSLVLVQMCCYHNFKFPHLLMRNQIK